MIRFISLCFLSAILLVALPVQAQENLLSEDQGAGGQGSESQNTEELRSGDFVAESLPPPTIATIGLLRDENGGLGSDLWQGTSLELAIILLEHLPENQATPALSELARRFLLTQAALPNSDSVIDKETKTNQLLGLRLQRLFDLEYADDAMQLYHALPDEKAVLSHLEIADILLDRSHFSLFCQRFNDGRLEFTGTDRSKLRLFCELFNGALSDAAIGLNILRELAIDDQLFLELAAALIEQNTPELDQYANQLTTPLHYALYQILQNANESDIKGQIDYTGKGAVAVAPLLLAADNQAQSVNLWPLAQLFKFYRDPNLVLDVAEHQEWLDQLQDRFGAEEAARKQLASYGLLRVVGLSPLESWVWPPLQDHWHQSLNLRAHPELIHQLMNAIEAGRKGEMVAISLIIARGRPAGEIAVDELAVLYQALNAAGQGTLAQLLLTQAFLDQL